jgi:hypothetical protein
MIERAILPMLLADGVAKQNGESDMDPAIAALTGAAIGAFAGLIGHIVNNWMQGGREKNQELRSRVVALVNTMGVAQQSMEWISWFGVNYPIPKGPGGQLDDPCMYKDQALSYSDKMEQLSSGYEKEMQDVWPKILGEISSIASYDFDLYEKAMSAANRLAALDVRVTKANMKKESNCRSDYEVLYTEIRAFGKEWLSQVAAAMHAIGSPEKQIDAQTGVNSA